MSLSKKSVKNLGIGTASVAAIALLGGAINSSGADFTASEEISATVTTATVSTEITDSDGGAVELLFSNLAPGDEKVQTFTVKNTGSIKTDVTLGAPFSGLSANIGQANIGELTVAIDGHQARVPVTSVVSGINLGSLDAGQSRTYAVRVGLDQAAGNPWQGKVVKAKPTLTLKQS